MEKKNTNARYTYITFAEEVKAILEGKIEITAEVKARVAEKADALIATQTAKKDYNAANPKKSTAKGASAETQAKATQIATILDGEPKTAAEINELLGTEYTALQVANAVKFIEGAKSEKVIRDSVNAKGLKSQKEYTAYTL